ncbi:hypothetical protein FGK60_20775 [Streptomyces sp. DASNCL29]|nr:hypothetical protein FGK60_20775 [Streptomyces sp. DASNCL29]
MAADPPHEVVLGDIARYTALRPVLPPVERGDPEAFAHFDEAGWSKVVMNFRLTPEGEGTLLSTETRVLNTDPATRRAFTLYWGLMRAGSSMIRAPRPGPRPIPRRQRLHPVHRRGGSDPGAPDGAGTAPDPARSRPGRQGATARKRSRTWLRRRGIPHTIPERADQVRNRARRGSRGGRPPTVQSYEAAVTLASLLMWA